MSRMGPARWPLNVAPLDFSCEPAVIRRQPGALAASRPGRSGFLANSQTTTPSRLPHLVAQAPKTAENRGFRGATRCESIRSKMFSE
jgi:hypothetical protein